MLIAVAVVDSPLIAGLALAWILAVILYARHTLRCPLCGASVLNAGVGKGVSWLAGRDRRCPRCKAGYEEAVSARVRGPVK
jgi:phage FluMu protein Com